MGGDFIGFVLGWSFSSYPMAPGDDWDEFGPISEFNLLKLKTTRSSFVFFGLFIAFYVE